MQFVENKIGEGRLFIIKEYSIYCSLRIITFHNPKLTVQSVHSTERICPNNVSIARAVKKRRM